MVKHVYIQLHSGIWKLYRSVNDYKGLADVLNDVTAHIFTNSIFVLDENHIPLRDDIDKIDVQRLLKEGWSTSEIIAFILR